QFVRIYVTHLAAWNFVSDMRVRVYDHLQKLSLRFFSDRQTGQLMSRTGNDTAIMENLIAHAIPDMIINILLLLGVAVMLFVLNTWLALFSLVTFPFLIFSVIHFARKVQPKFRMAQQCLAEFNAVLHDNITGVREIQAFNQQEREYGKVLESSLTHVKAVFKALPHIAGYHPSITFFSNIGVVFVIAAGGYLASQGRIPAEDIVAFILYLNIFYQPVSVLGRVNEDLQNALAGAGRTFEILDIEPDIKEKAGAQDLKTEGGGIRFENVSFGYINEMDVLREIDLDISPGEMVALVGPTGVGKTTFISLLSRYYDPDEGRILIDGQDIRDVTLKSLRDNISVVHQDIFLFNGTVAENIAYGVGSASHEDIVRAATVARAHEFILQMENGYDTQIGERGVRLSGGQKQRLSIARAVLRDSPILLLDEATASVDTETEMLIHEAIDQVIKDRTTIIIAHRLSSIKKADKIVVLSEGRIAETGRHEDLLRENGIYKKLYNIQFRD
ncbi:MAG: ABC transporter ATP-binding protein, partial [Eubacteriales bacterium]|nr:ABC transporter ATP-binding protein [Eubacteriales bacterium]